MIFEHVKTYFQPSKLTKAYSKMKGQAAKTFNSDCPEYAQKRIWDQSEPETPSLPIYANNRDLEQTQPVVESQKRNSATSSGKWCSHNVSFPNQSEEINRRGDGAGQGNKSKCCYCAWVFAALVLCILFQQCQIASLKETQTEFLQLLREMEARMAEPAEAGNSLQSAVFQGSSKRGFLDYLKSTYHDERRRPSRQTIEDTAGTGALLNHKKTRRSIPSLPSGQDSTGHTVVKLYKNDPYSRVMGMVRNIVNNANEVMVQSYYGYFYDHIGNTKDGCKVEHMPGKPTASFSNTLTYQDKETAIAVFSAVKETFVSFDNKTGSFIIKVTGIFLLHINMTIVDPSETHYAGLFLNDQAMFACQKGGFRCPRYNDDDIDSNMYRICNMDGTLELRLGDVLQLRTMEDNMTFRFERHRQSSFKFILLHRK